MNVHKEMARDAQSVRKAVTCGLGGGGGGPSGPKPRHCSANGMNAVAQTALHVQGTSEPSRQTSMPCWRQHSPLTLSTQVCRPCWPPASSAEQDSWLDSMRTTVWRHGPMKSESSATRDSIIS